MEFHVWAGFFLANLIVSLAPGPGAIASMNAGLAHGSRRGWHLVAGLQLALLLQLSVVALGAGSLLAASETTFRLLRWFGAAYLVWLGLSQLWSVWRQNQVASLPTESWPATGLLWRGVLVNLSNPKAVLFMAALVPQFIDPVRPLVPQYGLIAVTMCGIDALVMATYVGLAARLGPWLESPRLRQGRQLLFGTLFVLFGLALLGVERPA